MEYLDELNEDGTKNGRRVERSYAHEHGILHATSQIYIYRYFKGKLEILLQRRSETKDSYPGKLDISCAGHVPSGMDYSENALKELSEELGICITPAELAKVGVFRTSKRAEFYGKPFRDEQLSAVYITEQYLDIDKIDFQREEISEVVWMNASEINARLKAGSNDFCINYERFQNVLSAIKRNVEILYEDEYTAVCVKPAGVPSQGDLTEETDMLSALGERFSKTFYPVHRLDRNTGGVILYAANKEAAAALSADLSDKKKFEKEYLAVTEGEAPSEGEYKDYLIKQNGKAYIVGKKRSGAKEAELSFVTLGKKQINQKTYSLVRVRLKTGRFHQIRAQFASRRLPLCGDGKYGGRDNKCSVALWAYCIKFSHPKTKEAVSFSKKPPKVYPWIFFENELKGMDF